MLKKSEKIIICTKCNTILGGWIIILHYHKVPYVTLNHHILWWIQTLTYIVISYCTLSHIVHCHEGERESIMGNWRQNWGDFPTNSLPSTPHFKSLAEIILLGMISSLVFSIELSESPNLVPDSSMKPENGREMDWKGNEKTPQVELKPPWDDEKWDFAVKDL